MSLLIGIYLSAILAGVIAAIALALLGSQLAARDQAMQTLCLGQGASLGVLVGIGLLSSGSGDSEMAHFGPFLTAFPTAVGAYLLCERWGKERPASKTTLYTALFSMLLAACYLVSALFPTLESHMSQVFFGDLATLCHADAVVSAILSAISVAWFCLHWRQISRESFEMMTFGALRPRRAGAETQVKRQFHWVTLVVLCFSVQFLGFLFTMLCLFLPTGLLRFQRSTHLKTHLVQVAAIAATGTLIGFLISLRFSRLPTVPLIGLVMAVESACVILWSRRSR